MPGARPGSGEVALRFDAPPTLEALRATYLRLLVDRTGGNRREIAAILGISERNLYRLLADPKVQGPGK